MSHESTRNLYQVDLRYSAAGTKEYAVQVFPGKHDYKLFPGSPEQASVCGIGFRGGAVTESWLDTLGLRNRFAIAVEAEVEAFLGRHTPVRPVAKHAHSSIRQHFPTEMLYMCVYSDPEEPWADQLQITIDVSKDPDNGIKQMNELRRAWWLANSPKAQGKLAIGLYY